MSKLRNLVAVGALAAVALLSAGWFLLVSPQRSQAAALRTDADGVRSSTSSLQTQLAMLRAQAKNLPAQRAKLQAIAAKVPNNPAEPALVRALTKAADAAGVELISIAPATPAVISAPVAAAPAGAAPAAGGVASPVTGLQVAAIALKISATGTYFELEQFQRNLENLSRALKSTTISLAPGGDSATSTAAAPGAVAGGYSGTLTAAIGATVYMTVERAAAPLAGAGAAAPGPKK